MEVIIVRDHEEMGVTAGAMVAGFIQSYPRATLGLATGSTQVSLYQNLIARYRAGEISFAGLTTFNLDEYLDIAPHSPLSYRRFMNQQLFDHVNIRSEKTFLPVCAQGQDPRSVGPAYETLIRQHGGIDLQVLGIGSNGHIGFNEPSSSLGSRTRVKTLARRTTEDNSRLLQPGEFQPHLAITMGIATIMDAGRVLLLASGESKAAAVKQAVEGAVSAMSPASVLQQHQRVRFIVDEAAASQLELADYYRWVQEESKALAEQYHQTRLSDPWLHNPQGKTPDPDV